MRTAEQITSATKPFFDRMSDGLKVVGSGNTAGLVGMVAALTTVKDEHIHTVLLLKPTAIIFALGILAFASAYLLLMLSYAHSEHYVAVLHPNEETIPQEAARLTLAQGPLNASLAYMKQSLILTLASTFLFFLGFVVAFVALVRY
jgi:hypothetical protein